MYRLCQIFCLLIMVPAGCMTQKPDHTIVITGSSTLAPLIMEMGKRFETQTGVRVDVQTGGSSRGIADARSGMAHIGMSSRDLKKSEADLHPFPVARDGVAVILNNQNPVRELSKDQVCAIYRGEIRNWREVGGADAPITVVNKAEGRSTLEVFLHFFELKSEQIKPSLIIGDNQQGIKTVEGDPHAIGYVSVGSAEYALQQGSSLKPLPLEKVPATSENVKNGSFRLSRMLILVTREPPVGEVARFIRFVQSEQVRDLIEEFYFVPLH